MVRVEEIINEYKNLSAEIFRKSEKLMLREYQ